MNSETKASARLASALGATRPNILIPELQQTPECPTFTGTPNLRDHVAYTESILPTVLSNIPGKLFRFSFLPDLGS